MGKRPVKGWRGVAGLLVFVAMAGFAYLGARYWQAGTTGYRRLPAAADCELSSGSCRTRLGDGWVEFSIEPRTLPLMQPLRLAVRTQGIAAAAVAVDIRGLNMQMGLNRTALRQDREGVWSGETILPICSQRRMEWEAAVQIDADQGVEIPFLFATTRS